MELTHEEVNRFSRQLAVPEIGREGQQKLKNASLILVGMGGLGTPAALYLSACGVGRVATVDADSIETSNLHRQVLYGEEDVGEMKVQVARRELLRRNSRARVESYGLRLDSGNAAALIAPYDVVLDGSDSFQTRYLLNDACAAAGKPLVSASIHRWEGQLSVFNWKEGPCYRCLFPAGSARGNCADAGVPGPVAGVLGTLQAVAAIHVLLDLPSTLSGRLLLVDLLHMQFRNYRILKDPDCRCVTRNFEAASQTETSKLRTAEQILESIQGRNFANSLYLIDVRREDEYRQGKLPGAIHWPLDRLERGEFPPAPRAEWDAIVYCARGPRASLAQNYLNQAGWNTDALEGGIEAWMKRGFPIVHG